jgi:hypothetical protein
MDLQRIEDLGRRAFSGVRVGAWFLMVCGVLMAVLGVIGVQSALTYQDPICPDCRQDPTGSVIIVFGALLAIAVGLVTLVWASNGKNDPAYRLITKHAHDIVWVTSLPSRRRGLDWEHVAFHLASGRRAAATMLVPANQIGPMMQALQRLLPHASFGLEFAPIYEANPHALRRA